MQEIPAGVTVAPELWDGLDERQRADWVFAAHKRRHPAYVDATQFDPAAVTASEAPTWLVKTRDFGNGHREALVMRRYPNPWGTSDRTIAADLKAVAPRGESEDRDDNIDRAVRRAKAKVREVCKALAVNSLWTLTYRDNVTDRDLVLRHVDRFRRAVAAVLPGWKYVAVLEKQERGAWHVHLATHALPRVLTPRGVTLKSWDVMRGIWRHITKELGGNFDEAKRKTRFGGDRGRKFEGAGRIATYIAGYVAKDMHDSPLNRKRYSRSAGLEIPPAVREIITRSCTLRELVELVYARVGSIVTNTWFDPSRELFFIATDDTGAVG